MTIQELAQQYADLFVSKTRENGDKYLCIEENDKHTELRDLIWNAHNESMPDDYKYQFIHEALEALSECDDIDDIHLEPDCYNHDLLKWVSSNLNRAGYVEKAIAEYGFSGFFESLMQGQSMEKYEVLNSVRNSLDEIIEELNNA